MLFFWHNVREFLRQCPPVALIFSLNPPRIVGDLIVFVRWLVYNNLRCVCGSHKLQPLVVCIKLFLGARGLGESKFF